MDSVWQAACSLVPFGPNGEAEHGVGEAALCDYTETSDAGASSESTTLVSTSTYSSTRKGKSKGEGAANGPEPSSPSGSSEEGGGRAASHNVQGASTAEAGK